MRVLLVGVAVLFVVAVAQAASSSKIPVGDLPSWRQIFADDFTTPAPRGTFLTRYGAKWDAYPEPWMDTMKHGMYSPDKTLSVRGGLLDIFLHTENGVPYVSAPQPRLHGKGVSGGKGVLYGRFSVRFCADPVHGYKTAWLLWPDSELWPDDGEVDFPEGDLDRTIGGYAHYARPNRGQKSIQDAFETKATYKKWHIATLEWTPGRIQFILDGKVIGTSRKYVPHKPMHWVLQTETRLVSAMPPASSQGHVHIDWVVAYAMKKRAPKSR